MSFTIDENNRPNQVGFGEMEEAKSGSVYMEVWTKSDAANTWNTHSGLGTKQ
ncbi:MAG: hypothetical protein AB7P04_14540 [Bacteriovoracia bacterium]